MKICLPTKGEKGLSEIVYGHFGSAPYFTIYDTNEKSIQIVQNNNQHHNHGACQPLDVISKYNVEVIITNGMGKRAVQLLNNSGIKVYLLNGNTVEEAVKKFEANELTELTYENACGNHGYGCH
ncbi:MAG TPA: NifB/NifX family molybdenum-iron cluster-binding protein [Spirochaetota bacterium]|nr:NifB/NifX family molybdenum-iron cluster-binding protein [Spirochaetota bacterium]HOL56482.1 NifB/NifX family molybdenum-iron cluster-binding protein [Spirochaetota bacterium]HPP03919.1 NifB/NifX family molybdenum-iron cluster-binding protein [Spirochaetota bacterium]